MHGFLGGPIRAESIRQPASFLWRGGSETHLRPRGVVTGWWPLQASLDQVGPFATSVSDAAELLQAIAGEDPRDSTCLRAPVPNYSDRLGRSVTGLRIGVVRECFDQEGLDPQVKASVLAAADLLQSSRG